MRFIIQSHKHAPQNLRFFGVRYTLIAKKKQSALQAVRQFLFVCARVYAFIIPQIRTFVNLFPNNPILLQSFPFP
jgi:hypothetical protein